MKEMKTLTVGGETYRITDPEAARICDETIQEETVWSGKHTVDMLAPAFSESGSIVACRPVAGYPLTVTAQEGTIITHCGKNLWDLKAGVSYVEYTHGAGETNSRWGYRICLPEGIYTLHAQLLGNTTGFIYGVVNAADGSYKESAKLTTGSSQTAWTVALAEGDALYLYNGSGSVAEYSTNKLFNEYYNVQIELGSVATPYEAYNCETFLYDPARMIPARPGVNTFWADTGEVAVAGKLDPVAHMERLQNVIVSLGGNV